MVTEEEIRAMIAEAESAGVVEPQERRMIARVMRLGDRSVRGVMTPRPEVDWLDLDQDTATILARLHRSPHSRLPAARGGIDHAVGVVHARDVLHALVGGGEPDLAALVRQPPVIHDRADALDALEALRTSPVDMAFVVDEHGTFEGIVTAADILEAIAGQFAAPDAEAEPAAVRREDGSWLLAGWQPADEMADLLRLALPAQARLPHGGRLRARLPRPVPEAGRRLRDGELAVRGDRHRRAARRQGAGDAASETSGGGSGLSQSSAVAYPWP